jgi:hypothetical protein
MPTASNPISVLLDAIFALINIALSVVFSYLGTIGLFAVAGLAVLGVLLGVIALLRRSSR